ncbi:MAG TPA: hypothetical protein VJ739_10475 [Gemmataceae bacterium]|nr:hypothetical protein [Gemmataceae bacterium]
MPLSEVAGPLPAGGRRAPRLAPRDVGLLVAGLYAAACLAPISSEAGCALPGWAVLLRGWRLPFCVPWSANLLLLAGLLCLARGWHRAASRLGVGAVLLGLTCWALMSRPSFGYYFWQASMVQLALGGQLLARSTSTARMKQPNQQRKSLNRKN